MINKRSISMNQKGSPRSLGEAGAIPLLILVAVIGIIAALAVTSIAPFKNSLLTTLFPKKFSQAASTTDWSQLQHDPQHTGRTAVSVPPTTYNVAWAFVDKNHIVKNFVSGVNKSITDGFEAGFKNSTIFATNVQPIVSAGLAFFGSMNGTMYAVDAVSGDFKWEFPTQGAIMHTAGFESGVLVFGSMDGNIYGLDALTGTKKWQVKTGAGVSVAPVINNGVAYIGSRDGKFYALDVQSGTVKWTYSTRVDPLNPNSPFNLAPIAAPAALSEDGSTVFFGAENMFFYAINTLDGSEKWSPKKLVGQSFQNSWPFVKGNKVIVRTMSSLVGAEFLMEAELDALCGFDTTLNKCTKTPTNAEERTSIQNWLTQNPEQKTMYVFNVSDGVEPFQVGMARVTGNNLPPHPPVVDNLDRVLTYWRSSVSTFLSGGTFGSKHCPDISALDLTSGDRINIGPTVAFCPELDNGFTLTVGGDNLYMSQPFRGTKAINLTSGKLTYITWPIATWDGTNSRYTGAIIYYGNDSQTNSNINTDGGPLDPRPPHDYRPTWGIVGASIASTNGTSLLYINESYSQAIVAIKN